MLLLAGISLVQGTTITSNSCAQTDVVAAINTASPGDTVEVPAGSGTWSGLVINKPVHLKGAGIGVTNITLGAGNSITKQTNGIICLSDFSFAKSGGGNESKAFYINGPWPGGEPIIAHLRFQSHIKRPHQPYLGCHPFFEYHMWFNRVNRPLLPPKIDL